jgi:hypothetical protein
MYQPPAPRRRRRRIVPLWPVLAGIIALWFIAAVVTFALSLKSHEDDAVTGESGSLFDISESETPLRQAFSSCHSGSLADDDHTLVIDTEGADYESGVDTFDGLVCTLDELDTPVSVTAQMDNTRALDGMQTAEWDDFAASWTYHPDSGMDLIITENS